MKSIRIRLALILAIMAGASPFLPAVSRASGTTNQTAAPASLPPIVLTNGNGFWTNGPVVYRTAFGQMATPTRNLLYTRPDDPLLQRMSNNLTPERFERYKRARLSHPEYATNWVSFTNLFYSHFLPESLNHHVWTNMLSRTNGRTAQIWAERRHPMFWPANPPVVRWQTNSIVYGMKGFTALSPCWELEGAPGQAPVTLLTPRHGYTRGHGMGAQGIKRAFRGRKVWFATGENKVIEVRVTSAATRTSAEHGDYTILMFNEDLPPTIQPLRVVGSTNLLAHYPWPVRAPYLVVMPEQEGHAHVDLPGFTYKYMKGGDSGSPNLLPMPGELVFFGGRSTSGPSDAMQADIDALCKKEKVSSEKYQLRWLDLSAFPKYTLVR